MKKIYLEIEVPEGVDFEGEILPEIYIPVCAFGISDGGGMALHEFEGATKLRRHADKLEADNASLRALLRDLYAAANPSILEDAETGVRLSPVWNERILKEIEK